VATTGSRGAITGINVTPLIDIALVLLIIFLVTAKLIVKNEAMSADLPRAASGEAAQRIVAITLLASGSASVDGRPLPASDPEILDLLRAESVAHPDVRAIIDADSSVPHGRVMHALDLLRRAGISRVGFGVRPLDQETQR
jgi:biopolymer transport protein ExbD